MYAERYEKSGLPIRARSGSLGNLLSAVQTNPMVDPNKHYTLYEIVREKLIPGVTTIVQASNIVKTDKMTNNWLDASVIHDGNGKILMYQIRGEKIMNYIVQKGL